MIAGVYKEDMAVATGSEFHVLMGTTGCLTVHTIQSHIYFAPRVKFLGLVCRVHWSRAFCCIS